MPTEPTTTAVVTDAAIAALRDTDAALDAEEKRLAKELADVKGRRKAVTKALTALTGDKPAPRRRGRPRTNA
jgi:prefoldin subunit 5